MDDKTGGGIIDEVARKVQNGNVTLPPDKAIELAGKLYSDGRYRQAENLCRQIIQHNPRQADAHNILGVSLNAQGRAKEAITMLRRAIKLAPEASGFYANLGEIERRNGHAVEARFALKKAIELNPQNSEAFNNLGIIHYDRKEYEEALACYRSALALNPKFAEAYNNMGNAQRAGGDRDAAGQSYHEALINRENYPEAYNNLGVLLKESDKPREAEHALKKAISQDPAYIDAHNNLAALFFSLEEDVEALRILSEALKLNGRHPATLILTARIQLRRANYPAAEQACRMVIADDPNNAEALTVLGHILHETDRYDEAIVVLEEAIKKNPDFAEGRSFYGVALKSVGRLDEARQEILSAITLNDAMYGSYANLSDLVDFAKEPELWGRIQGIMEAAPNKETDQMLPLHFAYAKGLEDMGEHPRALDHYIIGGRLKRAKLRYVEEETFAFFDSIKKAFPAEVFANRRYKGHPTNRPVFIIGMPRSGSTLVEQILSSHPDVFGAGEVKYLSRALAVVRDRFPTLPRYPDMFEKLGSSELDIIAKSYLESLFAGTEKAPRVTDKLLTNYFFVGLIHILFPNARIINTRRDAVDTCLSAFTKLFKDDMPHSYDLVELGRYYRQYEALMDHWQKVLPEGVMTTVVYEDVVADTDKAARGLIEFLGLPWNDACLEFHKSDRPVKTASVAQVRKPIYNSAVERWRKYGPGLQPLIDALELDRKAVAPD
jgi:tetratricopeptide (TPR) repeat protein